MSRRKERQGPAIGFSPDLLFNNGSLCRTIEKPSYVLEALALAKQC